MDVLVDCAVCAKTRRRLAGCLLPDGWLYGEVPDPDDDEDVLVVLVCSTACAARFWKRGPDLLGYDPRARWVDTGVALPDGYEWPAVRRLLGEGALCRAVTTEKIEVYGPDWRHFSDADAMNWTPTAVAPGFLVAVRKSS